ERIERREQRAHARVDQVDTAEVPRRVAHAQSLHVPVARRHLEAHTLDADRAVAAPLGARLLDAKRKPQLLGARARPSDARTAQEALRRRLANFGMARAVVFHL